jgi:hypothetical protein
LAVRPLELELELGFELEPLDDDADEPELADDRDPADEPDDASRRWEGSLRSRGRAWLPLPVPCPFRV